MPTRSVHQSTHTSFIFSLRYGTQFSEGEFLSLSEYLIHMYISYFVRIQRMVGSESTVHTVHTNSVADPVHTNSVADLHCSDVGADMTCYFDADPAKQASIISYEIGMFLINVLKLKIAKIKKLYGFLG